MANSANLPAPFRGVDQQSPKAAIKSPFCEMLLNFNTTQEGVSLRNGDTNYREITTANVLDASVKVFGKYGESALFIQVYDTVIGEIKIYNVETSALAYTSAALGNGDFQTQFFNKYLYFFTNDVAYAPGVSWNGTAWAVVGYTGSGFLPRGGGNSYNNRNYIIQDGEAAYWYSGTLSVTGALTKIDLSGIVTDSCTLSSITTLTLSEQTTTAALQVFCMSNGEILFYSGTYPDSLTWNLVGRAKVGQLVSNYNSVFPYQGDAIILSDSGIASLRDLFLTGSNNALNLSINKLVQRTWKSAIQAVRVATSELNGPISSRIKGVWDDVNSRLIIYLPYDYNVLTKTLDDTEGNLFFIYNTLDQAWYFHQSQNGANVFVDTVLFNNKILMANYNVGDSSIFISQKEGGSNFTDRDASDATDQTYSYEMLSAPIPFPKTAVYEATAIEPIIESDLYAETNWNFVSDFGKQTSGNQTTNALTTSVAKPLANVGIQNITYVQVKMSGTTVADKTVGLDLYSYNVWYDSGEKGSR